MSKILFETNDVSVKDALISSRIKGNSAEINFMGFHRVHPEDKELRRLALTIFTDENQYRNLGFDIPGKRYTLTITENSQGEKE